MNYERPSYPEEAKRIPESGLSLAESLLTAIETRYPDTEAKNREVLYRCFSQLRFVNGESPLRVPMESFSKYIRDQLQLIKDLDQEEQRNALKLMNRLLQHALDELSDKGQATDLGY